MNNNFKEEKESLKIATFFETIESIKLLKMQI